MPLDYSLPILAAQSIQLPTPEESQLRQYQVEQLKQARQAQIDNLKDQKAIQDAFSQHVGQDGLPDWQGIRSSLSTRPSAYQKVDTFITKIQKDAADAHKLELENNDKAATQLAQNWQGVVDAQGNIDLVKYQAAYAGSAAIDPRVAKVLPEQFDPASADQVKSLIGHFIDAGTGVPEHNKLDAERAKALEQNADEKRLVGYLAMANPNDPNDYANRLAYAQIQGAPKTLIDSWRGRTVADAQQAMITPEKKAEMAATAAQHAQTQQNFERTFAETVSNHLAQQQMAKLRLGVAQQNANRLVAQANQNQPIELKPGTAAYRQAQDLADGTLTFADFQRLHSRAQADAPLRAAIYDTARTLNPNFNPAQFEMGFKFASNPKVRQQVASLKNVESGVDDLLKASDAAARSGSTFLNTYAVKPISLAVGNQRYSNFKTAVTAFADELSGALGYGSATDMSRDMGFSMTDMNQSPANFRSNIENIVMPFVARKKASILGQMGPYGQSDVPGGGQTAAPQVPASVSSLLKSQKPGVYELSDGHSYKKAADGTITVVK